MKILLDECIDRRLAKEIAGHEVKTVPQMGWATNKNGELLTLAEREFDVFVTVDRNLSFQQHLPRYAHCGPGLTCTEEPITRLAAFGAQAARIVTNRKTWGSPMGQHLTSAVLVTAARLRFGMNVNGLVWAAAREGGC